MKIWVILATIFVLINLKNEQKLFGKWSKSFRFNLYEDVNYEQNFTKKSYNAHMSGAPILVEEYFEITDSTFNRIKIAKKQANRDIYNPILNLNKFYFGNILGNETAPKWTLSNDTLKIYYPSSLYLAILMYVDEKIMVLGEPNAVDSPTFADDWIISEIVVYSKQGIDDNELFSNNKETSELMKKIIKSYAQKNGLNAPIKEK